MQGQTVEKDSTIQQAKEIVNQAVRDAIEVDISRGVLKEKTFQLSLKDKVIWDMTDKVQEANRRFDLKDIELKQSQFTVTKQKFYIAGLFVLEIGTVITGTVLLLSK